MRQIGQTLADSISKRIHAGVDVNDTAAKPLKASARGTVRKGAHYPSYGAYKAATGKQNLRDLFLSGRTMRSLKVLSVSENKGVIGFTDQKADLIAHLNILRDRQFGVSPKDRAVLNQAVFQMLSSGKIITTEH